MGTSSHNRISYSSLSRSSASVDHHLATTEFDTLLFRALPHRLIAILLATVIISHSAVSRSSALVDPYWSDHSRIVPSMGLYVHNVLIFSAT
jgi:hypothetical protein